MAQVVSTFASLVGRPWMKLVLGPMFASHELWWLGAVNRWWRDAVGTWLQALPEHYRVALNVEAWAWAWAWARSTAGPGLDRWGRVQRMHCRDLEVDVARHGDLVVQVGRHQPGAWRDVRRLRLTVGVPAAVVDPLAQLPHLVAGLPALEQLTVVFDAALPVGADGYRASVATWEGLAGQPRRSLSSVTWQLKTDADEVPDVAQAQAWMLHQVRALVDGPIGRAGLRHLVALRVIAWEPDAADNTAAPAAAAAADPSGGPWVRVGFAALGSAPRLEDFAALGSAPRLEDFATSGSAPQSLWLHLPAGFAGHVALTQALKELLGLVEGPTLREFTFAGTWTVADRAVVASWLHQVDGGRCGLGALRHLALGGAPLHASLVQPLWTHLAQQARQRLQHLHVSNVQDPSGGLLQQLCATLLQARDSSASPLMTLRLTDWTLRRCAMAAGWAALGTVLGNGSLRHLVDLRLDNNGLCDRGLEAVWGPFLAGRDVPALEWVSLREGPGTTAYSLGPVLDRLAPRLRALWISAAPDSQPATQPTVESLGLLAALPRLSALQELNLHELPPVSVDALAGVHWAACRQLTVVRLITHAQPASLDSMRRLLEEVPGVHVELTLNAAQTGPALAALFQHGSDLAALFQHGSDLAALFQHGSDLGVRMAPGVVTPRGPSVYRIVLLWPEDQVRPWSEAEKNTIVDAFIGNIQATGPGPGPRLKVNLVVL